MTWVIHQMWIVIQWSFVSTHSFCAGMGFQRLHVHHSSSWTCSANGIQWLHICAQLKSKWYLGSANVAFFFKAESPTLLNCMVHEQYQSWRKTHNAYSTMYFQIHVQIAVYSLSELYGPSVMWLAGSALWHISFSSRNGRNFLICP